MKLLESLSAGIAGAEDGSVRLYVRGTSTAATWYSDFEGTEADSSGAAIALDSNGAAEVYVNRLVTVSVYTDSGTVLKSFTAGESAPTVEYQGVGFTGSHYETALTGTGSGYATTLQAILDLAYTAFGAPDWKVDVNGTDVTIGAAVSGFAGIFFNVMDPTYGATGDGTTNDQPAIAAAIAACAAAGGGTVYFPAGDYRITSVLNVTQSVNLLGAGPLASIIYVDHASANGLRILGSTVGQFVVNLGIEAAQSNSGNHVTVDSASAVTFERVQFGNGSFATGALASIAASTTTRASFRSCLFIPTTAVTTSAITSASTARVVLTECEFVAPATYNPANGVVYANGLFMDRCRFTNSACTSGTFSCVTFNSTTVIGSLTGCEFGAGGGATVTGLTLGTFVAASTFSESQSIFGTGVTGYSYTASAVLTGFVHLGTREKRVYQANVTTGAATPFSQYGIISLRFTSITSSTIAFDANPPTGASGSLLIRNETGGAVNFVVPNGTMSTSTKNILDTGDNSWHFVRHPDNIGGAGQNTLAGWWTD